MIRNKRYKEERGAVVIEATLSLSFFIFMVIMLLSMVNLCTAQAKIGMALNATAKEISQYTYIYSLSGLNDIQKASVDETAETKEDVDTIVTGVADSFKQLKSLAKQESTLEETKEGVEESLGDITSVAEKIKNSENPSEWVMDILEIGANEGFEMLKGQLSGVLTKQLMKKHLTNESGTDCDTYLKKLGVINGFDGLECGNSALFVYGTDDIILNCRYELRIVQLLGVDVTYSISQNAYTKAWGGKALFDGTTKSEGDDEIVGGSFALVGDEEGKLFGVYASRAAKEDGYVDVIVHTSADGQKFSIYRNGGWEDFTHRDLAKWLKSKGYEEKTKIRLISCGAGADTTNLAQNLANKLNTEVLAPTDKVWATPDGELTVGPTKDSNTGTWEHFNPGVNPNAK